LHPPLPRARRAAAEGVEPGPPIPARPPPRRAAAGRGLGRGRPPRGLRRPVPPDPGLPGVLRPDARRLALAPGPTEPRPDRGRMLRSAPRRPRRQGARPGGEQDGARYSAPPPPPTRRVDDDDWRRGPPPVECQLALVHPRPIGVAKS